MDSRGQEEKEVKEKEASQTEGQELAAAFLELDSRGRKAWLREHRQEVDASMAFHMAPAILDSSPRVSSRTVALLARFGHRDVFESTIANARAKNAIRPGKVQVLQAQFTTRERKASDPQIEA